MSHNKRDAERAIAFGRFLKEKRQALRKTVYSIARDLGTSYQVWYRWERGAYLPSPEFLLKLATALQVPIEELITKSGTPISSIKKAQEILGERQISIYRLTEPIIKMAIAGKIDNITEPDLAFLLEIQGKLRQPLTAEAVKTLLALRKPPGQTTD